MLDAVDTRFKHLKRFILSYVKRVLSNNWPLIVYFVCKMNRNACYFHTRVKSIANCVRSWKRRKQRWVNIKHTLGKCVK